MSDGINKRLFVLDGMALAYRAFYALITVPMRTASGFNSSAIFGFFNTLHALIEHEQPTHLVACFDASGPTARHELYPEYKANRQAMPDELRASIDPIIRILELMNIPVLRYSGYEADDTIGTLARIAEKDASMEMYMVSQDKDLGQLISERCFLWKPGKRSAEHEVIDLAKLCASWEIERADQVIDILALMGDASDNIPGIPGVGEKTAKTLISQFGTVENLLAHTDQLKGKRRELVETHAQKAVLSKMLATIDCEVPLDCTLEDLRRTQPKMSELRAVLEEYELKGLVQRMCGKHKEPVIPENDLFATPKSEPVQEAPRDETGQMLLFEEPVYQSIEDTKHEYHLVDSPEKRQNLLERLLSSTRWCFDTETMGLDPAQDKILGISFAFKAHEAYYVPIMESADLEFFAPAFVSAAEKIGHNLKFDLQVLHAQNIAVSGPFFDTMLAHSALYPHLRHSMDLLAETMLNYETVKLQDIAPALENGTKGQLDMASIPLVALARYGAEDADVTFRLAEILAKELKSSGMDQLMREVEFPLVEVLASMEWEGVHVDASILEDSSKTIGGELAHLVERISSYADAPINISSPKQLGELLFDKLKLVAKPKKTKTGQYVTDEETLSRLEGLHPVIADILSFREGSKLKGTYLDALPRFISPVDGRIHTQLMQMVTSTGRLASQSPNLQNIPIRSEHGRLIRRAFVARGPEYSLLAADYSQIELRIMAALAGDVSMIAAFQEKRDIHTETAAKIYQVEYQEVSSEMRRVAKMVNFGIIYGISAFGLSQRLGCPRAEAAELIEHYFKEYPAIKVYMDSLINEARHKGYSETLLGRRRALSDIDSRNMNLRSAAERTAINTPIQGSAADMIKLAMVRVYELLKGKKSRLILQIHDELLVDLHQDEHDLIPQILSAMSMAMPLPHGVPVEIESKVASNWLDAH